MGEYVCIYVCMYIIYVCIYTYISDGLIFRLYKELKKQKAKQPIQKLGLVLEQNSQKKNKNQKMAKKYLFLKKTVHCP